MRGGGLYVDPRSVISVGALFSQTGDLVAGSGVALEAAMGRIEADGGLGISIGSAAHLLAVLFAQELDDVIQSSIGLGQCLADAGSIYITVDSDSAYRLAMLD